MHQPYFARCLSLTWVLLCSSAWLVTFASDLKAHGTAQIRHASIIQGTVHGSVHQMAAEPLTLKGSASVAGDLLVPGSPTLQLKESAYVGEVVAGTGGTSPVHYTVTITGNARVGRLIKYTNPTNFPVISAPLSPAGVRTLVLHNSTQSVQDFSTLRNLTLTGDAGRIVLPPGAYGDFALSGRTGLILGTAGAAQPAAYDFQRLSVTGSAEIQLAGPVIITLRESLIVQSTIGSASTPSWLTLRIFAGSLTLNGNATLHGYVINPNGAVTLNGHSTLNGGVVADELTVNGNSTLNLLVPPSTNQPPTVSLSSPPDQSTFAEQATILLTAATADADGSIVKVEFYEGATKLGEATAAPYQLTWRNVTAGTYTVTAKAIDNNGAVTISPAATITVVAPVNRVPVVTLAAPSEDLVLSAPATITLAATAEDLDGSIAKVEFYYEGSPSVKLGEAVTPPYEFTWVTVPAGTYSLTAKAYDNEGASAASAPRLVTVKLTLPHFTGFEQADGYTLGAIGAQLAWTASTGATIGNGVSYRGAQAMLLVPHTPAAHAAHVFEAHSEYPVVFVDIFARPVATNTGAPSVFIDADGAEIAIVRSGTYGELHTRDENGAWQPSEGKVDLTADGQAATWLRITIREDFASKKWDLYLDGKLIAYDLPFSDETKTAFTQLTLRGVTDAETAFDDLYTGFDHPLFDDLNDNGIDDLWETHHGLSLSNNNRDLEPAGSGWPVIHAYLKGTDPREGDPFADPDGDGLTNRQEYQLGRNLLKGALPDTSGAVGLQVYTP
jgi:PKD repeat protein